MCSFYLAVRKEANSHLVDGTGHKPHYSLRTLCRALKYVAANPCTSVQRSLYEVGTEENSFVFQMAAQTRAHHLHILQADTLSVCRVSA